MLAAGQRGAPNLTKAPRGAFRVLTKFVAAQLSFHDEPGCVFAKGPESP